MYWSRCSLKFLQERQQGLRPELHQSAEILVGEFLKPCGNLVQVNCVFLLVFGSSHSKANKGWQAGDRQRQKKASLRSRQVNQLA